MTRMRTFSTSFLVLALASGAGAQSHPVGQGTGQTPIPTTGGVETGSTHIPNTGPGDTVPPPGSPGSEGPITPGTVTPGAGGQPAPPQGPASGGPATGDASGATGQPAPLPRPTVPQPIDVSTWETWWSYNRDFYLDVERAVGTARTFQGDVIARTGQGTNPLVADLELIASTVAPALMSALDETNPYMLSTALIAIARLEPSKPARGTTTSVERAWDARLDDRIALFLAHPQLSVSETAAVALGLRARAGNAVRLAAVLADDAAGRSLVGRDWVTVRQRAFAAYGLGLVAERSGSEDLRRYVVHELWRVLEASTVAERELQVACVEALGLAQLDSANLTLQNAAAMPPSSSREALVAHLVQLLADTDHASVVRAHIPMAIARACEGSDEDLRNVALRAVLAHASSNDEKPEVRIGAVQALGRLARPIDVPADRDTRAALLAFSRDSDRTLRGPALIAAAEIGGRARTADETAGALELQKILTSEVAHGRSGAPGWAGISLGIFGRRSALVASVDGNRVLREALDASGSTSDLAAFGLALGLRQDRSAYELVLERAIREGDDKSRAAFALGVGLLARPEAVVPLRALVDRSLYRPLVLRDASIALALLYDKNIAPNLLRMFKMSKSVAAQSSLSDALGYVGDARGIAELAQIVRGKLSTTTSRTLAVQALGRIADSSEWPWNQSYLRDANYFAPTETYTSASGGGILDQR